MNLTDMNTIDIVQPVPKRAYEHFSITCFYCKYEAPHPSPVPSDWSSEDWGNEKAKASKQKSLIDFDSPKPDSRQTMDLETAHGLPVQNYTYMKTRKKSIV